jgi:hypothetical protein
MQPGLQLKPEVAGHLLHELEQTKVPNAFLFSLFAAPKSNKPALTIQRGQLMTEVLEVLYTFCLSKATLKSLARDLKPGLTVLFE